MTEGGDPPVLKIFWGDDWVEENSTAVDENNASKWDNVIVLNNGNPVGLGTHEALVENLVQNTRYYYRAYAENLGGGSWGSAIKAFTASDTRFTKHTMDGLLLVGCDRSDGDGVGTSGLTSKRSRFGSISLKRENAVQSVPLAQPSYAMGFRRHLRCGLLPANFNAGTLTLAPRLSVFVGLKDPGVLEVTTDRAVDLDANRVSVWVLSSRIQRAPANTLGTTPEPGTAN